MGLIYITGIDTLPKIQQKDKWDKNEFDRKREILNKIKTKIIKEAKRLLSFFQKGLFKKVKEKIIVIIEEKKIKWNKE
ncbi:hypothetical protein [Alkalihalobacillus sp. TS-13]|uniref:hypothetical protein n=1 Tax=Alkalihalobacillus sp. TS-13 TaxID=2842455 RepID=UPI001C868E54|nr:hypothetical protein [Alkalihalobacillus sp. TS-13]